jgi:hypothetical protein
MNSLKELFKRECSHIKIDKQFIQELERFEYDFVMKNETNKNFFSSHLHGVHPMRFTVDEFARWYDDIVVVDEIDLQDKIYAVPSIYKNNKVLSDLFNILMTWLMHKIIINNSLSKEDKQLGLVKLFLIWQYKYWGSLLGNNYKHPANEETAEATFNELSRKFGLKIHGTWRKFFIARAIELTSENSLHYNTLKEYTNDAKILYCIEDNWTRMKSLMKELNAVFYSVRQREIRQISDSAIMTIEGEKHIKDLVKKEKDYIRYVTGTMVDKTSFIKEELLEVVVDLVPSASITHIETTLKFIMDNITNRKYAKDIEYVTENIILYTLTYIQNNPKKITNERDISRIVVTIRNILKSPKNNEEVIYELRSRTENMVGKANGLRNTTTLANTRTAVLLYILLRAMAKGYYSR